MNAAHDVLRGGLKKVLRKSFPLAAFQSRFRPKDIAAYELSLYGLPLA
jgi:hypothetical protein